MIRKHVIAYTDGSALGNPGPGGYGTLLLHGTSKKELSGGFRRTTNNRMERVTLYTDSKYLANAISKGWAEQWQRNHWMRNKSEPALNPDLWATLLDLFAWPEKPPHGPTCRRTWVTTTPVLNSRQNAGGKDR